MMHRTHGPIPRQGRETAKAHMKSLLKWWVTLAGVTAKNNPRLILTPGLALSYLRCENGLAHVYHFSSFFPPPQYGKHLLVTR